MFVALAVENCFLLRRPQVDNAGLALQGSAGAAVPPGGNGNGSGKQLSLPMLQQGQSEMSYWAGPKQNLVRKQMANIDTHTQTRRHVQFLSALQFSYKKLHAGVYYFTGTYTHTYCTILHPVYLIIETLSLNTHIDRK